MDRMKTALAAAALIAAPVFAFAQGYGNNTGDWQGPYQNRSYDNGYHSNAYDNGYHAGWQAGYQHAMNENWRGRYSNDRYQGRNYEGQNGQYMEGSRTYARMQGDAGWGGHPVMNPYNGSGNVESGAANNQNGGNGGNGGG